MFSVYNTRLVSRSIAELLLEYDVTELHVSLTHGLWHYRNWGYPVVDAMPGAEVWAWFSHNNSFTENSTVEEQRSSIDGQWTKLSSILSGILCASLNFVDASNTITPKYSFRPRFAGKSDSSHHLRYAALPREIVCTENLTPWKKLLPCNSHSGLVSLLNSRHVYHSNYHSMGMEMRVLCMAQDDCTLEFIQTANLVFDPNLISSNRGSQDFSLRRLFGQGLNGHCPLAKSSKIYVNHNVLDMYTMSPMPSYNVTSNRAGYTNVYGVYDIKQINDEEKQQQQQQLQEQEKETQQQQSTLVPQQLASNTSPRLFNIAWLQRKTESGSAIWRRSKPLPPLLVHRYIMGRGQERGVLVTQITNNQHRPLPIVLLENIPWFMPMYLHTLRLSTTALPTAAETAEVKPLYVSYKPGQQRKRPYHLELLFMIPARSTIKVRCEFDYTFLKWLEYPPDANHGHHIGSAIITTQLKDLAMNYTAIPLHGYRFMDTFNSTEESNDYVLRLHTETLILSLPTPDFSMPYNAICLACTVVALAFGPIHSATTKRIILERAKSKEDESTDKDGNQTSAGMGGNVLKKIQFRLRKLMRFRSNRSKVATTSSEDSSSK